MKLIYYKEKNFGDQLNLWIWPKLIPSLFEQNNQTVFIGIGTLLHEKRLESLQHSEKKVIFSTGVGYGKKPRTDQLNNSYHIYCVRGPLSAQVLGLSETLAITDGAVLLRRLFKINPNKLYKFSYMPHYELAGESWNLVCNELGFGYIDPRWSIEKVMESISQSEVLLTEAMHGAIAADALRVPWIPMVSNRTILAFKWQDWCQSIGLEYQPAFVTRLHHPSSKSELLSPLRTFRDWTRQKRSLWELQKIAKTFSPNLSKDDIVEELTQKLEHKVENLKNDLKKGVFN
jgi:succinoglycan biosynthesis protein ExoV